MRRHLLILLALTACTVGDAAPEPGAVADEDSIPSPPFNVETLPLDSTAPIQRVDSLPVRPQALVDSVRVEGSWQRERLELVRSPSGFEPPFSTYVPAGMRTEFAASDSTPSVRFVAAFGGQYNPEAYLQVRMYPRGSSELVVRSAVDVFLRGRDPRADHIQPSEGWLWTIAAWDFQYGGGPDTNMFMGTIGIARHGDRYFHVLAHYPADYGDGIGPRIHRILQEWRWEDNGAPLIRP